MFKIPSRFVENVFIHCSASDNPKHDDVSVIRKWHTDKGWSDVGYHFFIQNNGNLQLGRPLERVPAAQKGFNTGSIAICLHGLLIDNFTDAQFRTLYGLCAHLDSLYSGTLRFKPHNEVNKHKTCPVFDPSRVLMLDEDQKMWNINHVA